MPDFSLGPTDSLRRRVLGVTLAAAVGKGLAIAMPDGPAQRHVVRPWPAGDAPLPPFDLADLDGRRWTLAPLRGRPLLLNFWASWCAPCRDEMPSLQALSQRHRAAGLQVLAVNVGEAAPAVQRFLQRVPVSMPVLLDGDGEASRRWTPQVLPSTVLIGRDGRPRSMVLGAVDWTGSTAAGLVEPLFELA